MKLTSATEPRAAGMIHSQQGLLHHIPGRSKRSRMLVVIASQRVAKFFMNNDGELELIAALGPRRLNVSADTVDCALGRIFISCSYFVRDGLKTGMSSKNDEFLDFLRDVVNWLEESATNHRFDRIVLVAAPAMLIHIRKAMSRHVRSLVSAEAARDLTKMRRQDIYSELKRIVRL